MKLAQRFLNAIAPPGTSRRQLPQMSRETVGILRSKGASAALSYVLSTFKAHGYGLLLGFGLVQKRRGTATPPPTYTYGDWIADNEPDANELERQSQLATALFVRPTFGIITPVYNPPPQVFIDTVESVLAQTYPHWKLYLADGGSDSPEVLAAIQRYAQQDHRVEVIHLAENLGISGNSNAALAQADCDFISLLDHDDLLAPNMLFEVACALQKRAESAGVDQIEDIPVDIVYFDEDKVSADGLLRQDPWFKPACGKETLLSHNFLMHCVLRKSLVSDLNGFDPSMDGAQDWDLMLRSSTVTDRVVHVPKILYHWRKVEGSAASSIDAKPWALEAQMRALQAHFRRLDVGDDVRVTSPHKGHLRILWPHRATKISLIVLTKDKPKLIRACLSSILQKSTYPNYEIIVVDTGSSDRETLQYYEELKSESRIRLVFYKERFNFSRANNFGSKFASGELLLFLNNDTEVLTPDWMEEMAGWALRPEVGIVGTKLVRSDGSIQHAGVLMGLLGHAGHVFDGAREFHFGPFGSTELLRNYQAVTGACLMINRALFAQLEGFDELYEIIFNDVDLCLRAARAGYRTVYTPTARLLHHEGRSRGYHNPIADVIRGTTQMWPLIRRGDPHFNPNLSYLNPIPYFAQPNEARKDQHIISILQQYNIVPHDLDIEQTEYADLFHDAQGLLPRPPDWPLAPVQEQEKTSRILVVFSEQLTVANRDLICRLAPELQTVDSQLYVALPSAHLLSEQRDQEALRVDVRPNLICDVRETIRALVGDGTAYDAVIVCGSSCWLCVHVAKAYHLPIIYLLDEETTTLGDGKSNRHLAEAVAYASKVIVPTAELAAKYRAVTEVDNILVQSQPHAVYEPVVQALRDLVGLNIDAVEDRPLPVSWP